MERELVRGPASVRAPRMPAELELAVDLAVGLAGRSVGVAVAVARTTNRVPEGPPP